MTTTFFEPKHHNIERAARVGAALDPRLPILATPGRLTNIADADRMIGAGMADVIGVVRGLIAEPELMRNAREGKEHRSRVCIAVNHCFDATAVGHFECAINPSAGREQRWGVGKLVPAPRKMSVTVVGGGPAGLEAARVAATRGHQLRLLERRASLGGALELWARLPGREHLRSLTDWYERMLAELDVDTRTAWRPTCPRFGVRPMRSSSRPVRATTRVAKADTSHSPCLGTTTISC